MGTLVTLLLAVPFTAWLLAVVIGTQRRERLRLHALESGAAARGWTYTTDSAEIRPRPPHLRQWQRPIRFKEGISGRDEDGQDFGVAHIVHESVDADPSSRRRHAMICWMGLPFPLNEVRIVPVERIEAIQALVGGEQYRTGEAEFDDRYRILTNDELLGRMVAGPTVRTLLISNQLPLVVTVQGATIVVERADRVPRNVEDALNGVAIVTAVVQGLTGRAPRI